MAATSDVKTWLAVFALCMVLTMQSLNFRVCAEPRVPCLFGFGDFLADNGNNNELDTSANVNYPPYGIDFPDGPTGRFTNGRNALDFLVEFFGFEKSIPPFATANGFTSLDGVSYGSGTSGILAASGKHLGDNIYLGEQIVNHRKTISRIAGVLGNKTATERLSKCSYWIIAGKNDYVNNYYAPGTFYPYRRRYNTEEYADLLIKNYRRNVTTLYNLGAREIVMVGLSKLGCMPIATSLYKEDIDPESGCVEFINDAAFLFNSKLEVLVDELNRVLKDGKFIYIDTVGNSKSGANELSAAFNSECCPVNELGFCIPYGTPCEDRNGHVFWDSFNPTEIFGEDIATTMYKVYVGASNNNAVDTSRLVHEFGRTGPADVTAQRSAS